MSNLTSSTYNFVAAQTLGTATSSVTFSNIPQNYTDLILVGTTIHTTSSTNTYLQFNGDVSSNYGSNYAFGNGSSPSGGRISSGASGIPADYSSSTTNPSMFRVHIMGYSNPNMYKSVVSRNDEGSSTQTLMLAGLWKLYSAITSLTLTVSGGNFASGSVFTLYGIKAADIASITPTKAIGGDIIVTDGTYTYHAFKSTGAFVPATSLTADILIVAGGGGTNGISGGAGAGGLVGYSAYSLTAGTSYTCLVGAGGALNNSNSAVASQGGSSQFGALTTAIGGGYGGPSITSASNGGNGGNGGGGGPWTGSGSAGSAGTGTANQGNNGGAGTATSGSPSAGGGGAGGAGSTTSGANPGPGGIGATYNTTIGANGPYAFIDAMGAATNTGQIYSGHYYYAGGGGGSFYNSLGGTIGAAGGIGGGGTGTRGDSLNAVNHGTPFTGGGAGGGANGAGASGGSGIIIVRYLS